MGKRRAKHPFEDNPIIDGFVAWMDAPEGQQSIEALDLVSDALGHAGVDASQRKIVWADGKRLGSISGEAMRHELDGFRRRRSGDIGAQPGEQPWPGDAFVVAVDVERGIERSAQRH